jgi:hypothetical protein
MRVQDLFIGAGRIPLQLAHHKTGSSVWLCAYTLTLVWNYKLDRWGMLSTTQTSQPICCQTNSVTFETLTVSGISAGVPTLTQSSNFGNNYTLRMFQGSPFNRDQLSVFPRYFFTTGWFGQPDKLLTIQRVNPVFTARPTTASQAELTVYGSQTPSNPTSLGTAKMSTSFRFDTLGPGTGTTIAGSAQNFFSVRYDFTSAADTVRHEIVDIVPKLVPAGER